MTTYGDGENDTEVRGKYLLIKVPDYDPSSEVKTSYIRLGAPNTDWQNEAGADLALMAYLAGAAGKEADNSLQVNTAQGAQDLLEIVKSKNPAKLESDEVKEYEVNHPFIDDARIRGEGNSEPLGPPGHGFPVGDGKETPDITTRRSVSADLHAKCGWRDHCDGNRITTTYGDKVEVVWGNYKMIVMGRQFDPGQAMGWEASGNNVQDYAGATMPGASVTVDWIKSAYLPEGGPRTVKFVPDKSKPEETDEKKLTGGLWLLQNSTENVWQYSRNAGNFKEQNWGDLWETYVGSENPKRISEDVDDGMTGHPRVHTQAELPPGTTRTPETEVRLPPVTSIGLPRGNPHIIEKTWAIKIESYTGSAAWRIPTMSDTTYAEKITELVDCSGTISSTTRAGKIEETTKAGSASDSTTVDGSITSDTTAHSIAETTTVTTAPGTISSTTTALSITDITTAPHISSITNSVSMTDVTLTANLAELFVGTHASLELGVLGELFVGGHASIEVALAFDLFVGGKLEIAVGGIKEIGTKKANAWLKKTTSAALVNMAAAAIMLGGPPDPDLLAMFTGTP